MLKGKKNNRDRKQALRSYSKRKDCASVPYIKEQRRKIVETTTIGIKILFLMRAHAVTSKGWPLKIAMFIFAFALKKAL